MAMKSLLMMVILGLAAAEEDVAGALALDGECESGEACALNALQLRGAEDEEEDEEVAAEGEGDEEDAVVEQEEGEEEGSGWGYLYNQRTRKCLTVGGKVSRKQKYLVIDECGKAGEHQKFKLGSHGNLRVKVRDGDKCVSLTPSGKLVTKSCNSRGPLKKWKWDKSNFGVQGWLENGEGGDKVCIGVVGSQTAQGTLVSKEKCDYWLASDQKWEWHTKASLLQVQSEDAAEESADEEESNEEADDGEAHALQEDNIKVAEYHQQLLSETGGRDAYRQKSQCCLCADGTVSWSARGICSHCHRIQRTLTPKKKCQAGTNKFIGSRSCLNICLQYFPHSHAYSPGGYPASGYPASGYHPSAGGYPASGYHPSAGGYPAPGGHAPGGMCSTQTSGTCKIFSCSSSRGPVDCVKGKCICKPGACSDGNRCAIAR